METKLNYILPTKMKKIFILSLFLSFYSFDIMLSQSINIDSLKTALSQTKKDTNRVNLYIELSHYYSYKFPDTVLYYAADGLALARKLDFKKVEIYILVWMGEAFNSRGNYPK